LTRPFLAGILLKKVKNMLKSINICTYSEDIPLNDVFAEIKAAGFDYAELNMYSKRGTYPNIWNGADDEEILAVGELAKKHGITPVGIVSAELWEKRLTEPDPAVREAGMEVIRKMIHVCEVLGMDTVLVVPGVVSENVSYKTAYENAQSCLKVLGKEACAKGIVLAVENVWNKFLLSPLEMRRFIDECGEGVGAYFDAGNIERDGFQTHWVEVLAEKIRRVHVKGFDKAGGNFCYLHEGTIDWKATFDALKAVGYEGPVSTEMWTEEGMTTKYAVDMFSADMDNIMNL